MQNNDSVYLNKRNELLDKVRNNKNVITMPNSHQFTLVSANLLKFMPEIPFDKHEEIYKEIILHNGLTYFEQSYKETFDYVTYENLSPKYMELLKTQPCVLSGFHFGTYRLFNTFLVKNNIPYTIVGPKAILERDAETFKKIHASGNFPGEYRSIELESPALGLRMLRELKNGRSVFIYFDGNRGIGNNKNVDEGQINFLNGSIMARKGVAYLANAANVPLITAMSYRKSIDDIRLHFFDPIYPNKSVTKDEFAHSATQLTYDRFAPFLKQYPGQWEAWLYLHKSIDHANITEKSLQGELLSDYKIKSTEKYSFNPSRYGLFKIREESFLFNKQLYKTYPIDNSTYDILEKSTQGFIGKTEISNNYLFTQFFDNRVLLAV